jgi:hypothetical protein
VQNDIFKEYQNFIVSNLSYEYEREQLSYQIPVKSDEPSGYEDITVPDSSNTEKNPTGSENSTGKDDDSSNSQNEKVENPSPSEDSGDDNGEDVAEYGIEVPSTSEVEESPEISNTGEYDLEEVEDTGESGEN